MESYSEALKGAENALRDLIEEVLQEEQGDSWIHQCGVSQERIQKWRERHDEERRRLLGRGVEERLLYYADFYDLPVILKKHWPLFQPCFGDWKTMEVYLDKLEDYRNPDAHRRDLFPYEQHLILGIAGTVRTAITNFRSQRAPTDEFFPKIEWARDSFGNVADPDTFGTYTRRTLRPGDRVTFQVKVWDPHNEPVDYQWSTPGRIDALKWVSTPEFVWEVTDRDVGLNQAVAVCIRSRRKFHAHGNQDDEAMFFYDILPTR